MLKRFSMYFVIVALLALTAGCGKKDNSKTDVKQDPNDVNADAYNNLEKVNINNSVTLKYNFTKGEKFSYRLTTSTNGNQVIQGDSLVKMKSSQVSSYTFDFTVLDVDKDNIASLNTVISSMKIDADINGQKINYDSKANNTPQVKAQFMEYETITNSPFLVNINSKGEVIRVANLDKIISKLVAAQPKGTKINAEQKAAFTKSISQVLQPIVQLIFKELADKPVAKDSTWTRQYPGNLAIFQMVNTAKYKLQDFVKVNGMTAAKVKADLSVKWTGNKQGSENGMNYNFSDPVIGGGGIILFGVEKGKIIKSETATNVEMNVTIEAKDANQKMKKTTRKDVTSNKNVVELL
jgi:hypothetical protein